MNFNLASKEPQVATKVTDKNKSKLIIDSKFSKSKLKIVPDTMFNIETIRDAVVIFTCLLLCYVLVTNIVNQTNESTINLKDKKVNDISQNTRQREDSFRNNFINKNAKFKEQKIAEVIWCENRTSKESLDLTLSVIYNRASEKTIDALYREVVKPKQFSCLNSVGIIKSQVRNKKDLIMLRHAKYLVSEVKKGNYRPKISAKFFYASSKMFKPTFLEDKKLVLAFEGHEFYK